MLEKLGNLAHNTLNSLARGDGVFTKAMWIDYLSKMGPILKMHYPDHEPYQYTNT